MNAPAQNPAPTQALTTDVAIIGAGPAGLFAAFECSMLKMSSLLIDALGEVGGQCSALPSRALTSGTTSS